uniref:(California timema) hypothetical protein n=1 Tax=Timema californicum TaxID=61474 RepID=A0A7R9P2J8_TIMCA|nr:unnamed protein product [Timema californicum]
MCATSRQFRLQTTTAIPGTRSVIFPCVWSSTHLFTASTDPEVLPAKSTFVVEALKSSLATFWKMDSSWKSKAKKAASAKSKWGQQFPESRLCDVVIAW